MKNTLFVGYNWWGYVNPNEITGGVLPNSNAISFYPVWESLGFDEWLYNGLYNSGIYQFFFVFFLLYKAFIFTLVVQI